MRRLQTGFSESGRYSSQLSNYYVNLTTNDRFSNVKGFSALTKLMVETKKDTVYNEVYELKELALIFIVIATSSLRKVFLVLILGKI